MNEKEIFYEEIKELKPPKYHVLENMENITSPLLMEIDMMYRFADALSLKNAKMFHNELQFFALLGGLIALYFLYYDVSSSYLILIIVIFTLIFYLFLKIGTDAMDDHGKYLRYRVLAETYRVQFFISYAGIIKPVKEMMPWIFNHDLPWIEELLEDLDFGQTSEKKSVLKKWIIDQKEYHTKALELNKRNYKKYKRNQRYSLILTIGSYLILFVLDVILVHFINFDVGIIRDVLKLFIGFGAVYTLYSVNYYGKLSLLNAVLHNKRMIKLYEDIEKEIGDNNGVETEEMIIRLAKQCLIENAIWYSSLIDNKPDWVL